MTFHGRNDTVRSAVIKRIALYSVFFFVLGIAQCSFFANLTFLDTVPSLVLGGAAAISLADSQKAAAICGIASGFMIDAIGGAGISLSPLVYFAIALICSAISKKMLPNFLSWLIVLLCTVLLNAVYTCAYIMLSFSGMPIITVLKSTVLPEAIFTYIFCLPLFFIVKKCVDIADTKNKFKM